MRKMLYKMENGTVVNGYKEAKATGLKYKIVFEEIKEPVALSPKQKRVAAK